MDDSLEYLEQKLTEIRAAKEKFINEQKFEDACQFRDYERKLMELIKSKTE